MPASVLFNPMRALLSGVTELSGGSTRSRADPGISRLRAVLIAAPDGTWAVLDPGSANGKLLNGRKLAIGNLVPLHDGDRIDLGAWTMITVHRRMVWPH